MNDRLADVLRKSSQAMAVNAELQKDWRAESARKRAETVKAWGKANPSKLAKIRRRVWSAKAKAIAELSRDELAHVTATLARWMAEPSDVWKCHYCGCDGPRSIRSADHVIPISKGGEHRLLNLVRCCRKCNSRKWALEVA